MSKATKTLWVSLGLTLLPIAFEIVPRLTFLPVLGTIGFVCYFMWPLGVAGLSALALCWLRSRFSSGQPGINEQPIVGYTAVCLGVIINICTVVFVTCQSLLLFTMASSNRFRGLGIIVAGVSFYSLIVCGLVSYLSLTREKSKRYSLVGFALSVLPMPLSILAMQVVRYVFENNSV